MGGVGGRGGGVGEGLGRGERAEVGRLGSGFEFVVNLSIVTCPAKG